MEQTVSNIFQLRETVAETTKKGYGFLSHLKSDLVCQHLPVIMLTSRSGNKHRQLAMNLGASAYFSKPFKENKLLATIGELIN